MRKRTKTVFLSLSVGIVAIHCFHSFLFHSFYGYCFRFIGCNFTLFCFVCFALEKDHRRRRRSTEGKEFFPIFLESIASHIIHVVKLKNCFNTQQLNATTKFCSIFISSFFRSRSPSFEQILAENISTPSSKHHVELDFTRKRYSAT